MTIQDSGTEEGTEIATLNFGDNLAVEVTGGVALIHGDAGSGAGVTLSDDLPVNIGPQGPSKDPATKRPGTTIPTTCPTTRPSALPPACWASTSPM